VRELILRLVDIRTGDCQDAETTVKARLPVSSRAMPCR
jgi:hypothetical protein